MNKILVVDDEETLRMLIVDTLEDEGYEIEEASDGEEAVTKMTANEYDLVLLDYMMPGLSGIEVMRKVRELPNKKEMKILMLTAKTQKQDIELAYEAGATSFLSKPFSPKELVKLVGDLLNG